METATAGRGPGDASLVVDVAVAVCVGELGEDLHRGRQSDNTKNMHEFMHACTYVFDL